MNTVYEVKFTKEALKAFGKLTDKRQRQVATVIEMLKINPYHAKNVKLLQGTNHDDYRIRIGQLRLIYRIENNQLLITVLYLGSRGDAYK